MKFQRDIFRTLDMQHDGVLSKFVFDMVMRSKEGKALFKELEKLQKEAKEAKDEPLQKKAWDLDNLFNSFRDQAVDTGVAVGFVLAKNFEIGNREAKQEFQTIEEKLKAKLPLWPRRIELKEGA